MAHWILTFLFAVLFGAGLSATASDLVYTNQHRFRIPYHSDPAELQRLGAREVQLFVTTDRGATWRLAQSVPPTTGKFAFEAPSDGEFWFSVRTLDGFNRLHPQTGGMTPGLKVMVDTAPPDLTLSLDRSGTDVRLTWRASDPNIDPGSLKLEHRLPGVDQWQPLSVASSPSGQTAWPVNSKGTVLVRGTILDRAGNTGSAKAELNTGEAGYAPLPANPALEGPIANESPNAGPFKMAADRGNNIPSQFASDIAEVPEINSRPPVEASTAESGQSVPTKVVGTRAFNLGYQVEEVGPSGVGSVDFFITDDGGKKWYRYGSDPDLVSPIRIDVPGEGSYGFQVRARSGVGLSSEAPRPGEQPAVTVVVDETPPVVTFDGPRQRAGQKLPVVELNWKSEDANPALGKSIDLEYATSADGPWTAIAKGIDDRGVYEWATDSVPQEPIFLKVSSRDAAGNVGTAITEKPLIVDLTRPTARITDIEVEPIK